VANFAEHVLVPGRALCVSLFCRNRSFDVLNVHNHNLSAQEVKSISQFTNTLSLNIRSDPCSRMAVLTGDLNIKAEGEMAFKIGQVFAGGATKHRILQSYFSWPKVEAVEEHSGWLGRNRSTSAHPF
jgi:hypothetical protein